MLWPELIKVVSVTKLESQTSDTLLPPVYKGRQVTESAQSSLSHLPVPHGAKDKLMLSKVLENRRLTSDEHFQDTRLIKLSCDQSYDAGDVAMVHPANDPTLVSQLLARLGIEGETSFVIEPDTAQVGQLSKKSLIPFPN